MVWGHISFSLTQSSLLLVSEISAGISSDIINWWIINTKFNTWVIIKYWNRLVYWCSWLTLDSNGTCKCPKLSIQGTPATVTNSPRLFLFLHLHPCYGMGVLSHWSLLLFLVFVKNKGPYASSPFSSATCCPPFHPQVITTPSGSSAFLPDFLVSLISSLLIWSLLKVHTNFLKKCICEASISFLPCLKANTYSRIAGPVFISRISPLICLPKWLLISPLKLLYFTKFSSEFLLFSNKNISVQNKHFV